VRHAFRALKSRNYRLYFGGQTVSLIGTWMHIIGQSWLVLRISNSGFAVGFATALQFGPMLIAGVWGGLIADRISKKKLLILSQAAYAVEALLLAVLVATGLVELWMVYACSLLAGIISVIDVPARQAFVSEMVGDDDVTSAVSLNGALFNLSRMVGPAAAGILIAATKSIELCFFINALSFAGVIVALLAMREGELHRTHALVKKGRGQIREGLRYVRSKPDLLLPIVLMGVVSTFGLNFQIILPVLARFTYGGNSATFGFLSLAFAGGALVGSLFAGTRKRPTRKVLVGSALAFGALETVAAFAPTLTTAYIALPLTGLAGMCFIATANSTVQLNSSVTMRGRAMSMFSLVLLGSTPIGGPIIGWVSEAFSPRHSLALGGLVTLAATSLIGAYLLGQKRAEASVARLSGSETDEDVLEEAV
jgi:MFS family permease